MSVLSQIGQGLSSFSASLNRVRMMSELSEMSDAQLAKRGLTRDRIVDHVFRNF